MSSESGGLLRAFNHVASNRDRGAVVKGTCAASDIAKTAGQHLAILQCGANLKIAVTGDIKSQLFRFAL